MARTSDKSESAARPVNGRFAREDGETAETTPEEPTDLHGGDWKSVLKRTFREFKEDDLTDWAAALTYYGVLSLFPGLLVLVSLLGLFGTGTTQPLIDNLTEVAPGPARDIIMGALENLQNTGAAGIAFFIGIAGALWSASNYVGAFMRASNAIWDVEEGRPFWKLRPLQIAITLVGVIILAVISVALVVSGPVAQAAGDMIGLGDVTVTVYQIAKWPVIALVIATMIAGLYYLGPNVKHPKFQWVSPGGLLAVVLWVLASLAFAWYVTAFPNNKTYGALGGVIFFLTWLWISNIVILLGAELNAELERQRQVRKGMPEDREPFLPLKQKPKK